VVVGALLYGRALTFGFTGTDDTLQIVDEAAFLSDLRHAPAAFGRGLFAVSGAEGYYRPVVTLSYMLDAQVAPARPGPGHATNVVAHLAVSVLLLQLIRRLGFARDIALVTAALFLVHPAQTEAASWIPARGDVLLGLWVAGALLALVRFAARGDGGSLAAHLGFFLLALFTKEPAVMLPAVALAYGGLVTADRRWMRDPRLWLGWLAAGALWLAGWWRVAAGHLPDAGTRGALGEVLLVPLRLLGQAVNPFHPAALAVARDTPLVPGVLALAASALALVWLGPRGRGMAAWGLASFALLMAPSLSVTGFLLLEHRLYAGCVVLYLVLPPLLTQTLERRGPGARRHLHGAAVILAAVLAVLSFSYSSSFRDAEAFTAQAAAVAPHGSLARLSRGVVLQSAGRLDEAEQEYRAALDANPTQLRASHNLGAVRFARGDLAGAEALFRRELALNPGDDLAHYDLAVVLMRRGRLGEAVEALHASVRSNPQDAGVRHALVEYYEKIGDTAAAARYGAPAPIESPGGGH
jgi:Flp pilus assembly protein TadD